MFKILSKRNITIVVGVLAFNCKSFTYNAATQHCFLSDENSLSLVQKIGKNILYFGSFQVPGRHLGKLNSEHTDNIMNHPYIVQFLCIIGQIDSDHYEKWNQYSRMLYVAHCTI